MHGVPIAFVHPTAYNTLEFAKSQIEWMCDEMVTARWNRWNG